MGYRGIPEDAAINGEDGNVLHLPTRDPREALDQLFDAGVRHLMVEGGSRILSAFLAAGLVDELIVYLAPTLLGSGTPALEDLGITTLADAQHWEWDPASGGAVQTFGRDLRLHLRPATRPPRPPARQARPLPLLHPIQPRTAPARTPPQEATDVYRNYRRTGEGAVR